jgi:hypothetical protein
VAICTITTASIIVITAITIMNAVVSRHLHDFMTISMTTIVCCHDHDQHNYHIFTTAVIATVAITTNIATTIIIIISITVTMP